MAIQSNIDNERAEMERQAADEIRKIEEEKNLADEDKERLLAELQARRQQHEDESAAHANMLQKLKQMEEKMLVGSQVMEKAVAQEAELKKAQYEVDERKRQEARMKEELEQQMEEKLNLEQQYNSAEEQVSKMTTKLEKLWHRHKNTQQEIQDLQKEFQQEREDMLENIRELRKEVKLVQITIENFIPMEHYQQIVERAQYDESTDEWVISNIDIAGNRIRPNNKKRLGDDDRELNPHQALLRGHQQNDQNPEMNNERPNVYFVYTEDGAQRAETRTMVSPQKTKNQRTKSAGRPGTASRKGRAVKQPVAAGSAMPMSNFLHSPEPEDDDLPFNYPKARGLVKSTS